ncbi:MAG: hypothetical protein HYY16_15580 [Planctomycetes bacterium]|nr:hypothetical protein [Planctomycetota bacterium]
MSLPLAASLGGSLIVIGVVLLISLLLLLADRLVLTPRARLTVDDVVTKAGQPIRLRALVERDILPFLDPPLPAKEVVFHLVESSGRRAVGSARTNANGIAEIARPPAESHGRSRYVATLQDSLKADDAELIVDVLSPETPVLVIDIDRTIADASSIGQALRENRRIRAVAGAPEALRTLASRFALVFLTARDHVFRAKTIEWLQSNGFPEAPVLLRGKRYWRQKAEDYKRERLAQMAAHVTLTAGVGDLPADARVYRERSMRAYLIGRAKADGAITLHDWNAILEDLRQSPATQGN